MFTKIQIIWRDTRFQFNGGLPNGIYVGWDKTIARDKDDIIDIESIKFAWKLQENEKDDKVKINENGHMEINIY